MRQTNESNSVKRHSKLGIASTIIGVAVPLLVIHDWSLPISYVGFDWNDSWDYDPHPTVYM